jgi:uncharacterized lipoprotein YehR (DUF1307 family)
VNKWGYLILKKWMSLGITTLAVLSLAACGNGNTSKQSSSSDDQSAKVASLKKENASLKKSDTSISDTKEYQKVKPILDEATKQYQTEDMQGAKQTLAQLDGTDWSKASLKSLKSQYETLKKDLGMSGDTSTSKTTSSSTSEATVNNEGTSAADIKAVLVNNFGCDASAVAAIPDSEIVKISNASSSAGEDIGGFYKRVKAQYSNIGGNVLGKNADSTSSSYEKGPNAPKLLSEDELPWGGMGQRPSFDKALEVHINNGAKLAGFELISGTKYSVYFVGSDSPSMTVDVMKGDITNY